MKTILSLAIASTLMIPLLAHAEFEEQQGQEQVQEQQEQQEQLPTIVVEGSAMRAGTFGTAPDSSGLKDTASLLKNIPGANVNCLHK